MGRRSESVKIEDQRFQHLRKFLLTFCLKARADNTLNQYRYTFKAFCRWCDAFLPPISSLPAAEEQVAIYIISLAKDSKSSGKIQSSINAISWAFYRSVCIYLRSLKKEGSIRDTSKPVLKKEPITPDYLKLLVQRSRSDNLFNMQTLSMCLLGFTGFLRYLELANIKLCDISFENTHMTINIVRSKTDVYKEGH